MSPAIPDGADGAIEIAEQKRIQGWTVDRWIKHLIDHPDASLPAGVGGALVRRLQRPLVFCAVEEHTGALLGVYDRKETADAAVGYFWSTWFAVDVWPVTDEMGVRMSIAQDQQRLREQGEDPMRQVYCAVCNKPLDKAPATWDGEPTFVGFLPCPDHPKQGVRYDIEPEVARGND